MNKNESVWSGALNDTREKRCQNWKRTQTRSQAIHFINEEIYFQIDTTYPKLHS